MGVRRPNNGRADLVQCTAKHRKRQKRERQHSEVNLNALDD
jgi:hypothetical protein